MLAGTHHSELAPFADATLLEAFFCFFSSTWHLVSLVDEGWHSACNKDSRAMLNPNPNPLQLTFTENLKCIP
jgi:hypothetical protein